MRTMHLFAGAGGGLLADLILGHTPIVAVEWDGYCCQVLRERAAEGWFPELHVWEGDVRLFDPSEYSGKVDCIHAGFPCHDISVAGKQAGVGEETRSGLYREVLRIARVVRPGSLFLENVSAIVANGIGTVIGDLAALGYDCEWLCLRASDCGANHLRDRWWLRAYPHCVGSEERVKSIGLVQKRMEESTRGVRLAEFLLRRMIPTPNAGSSHWGGRLDELGGKGNPFRGTAIGKLKLNPVWMEIIMGFPPDFSALKHSEMPKSRSKQQSLGSSLEASK